MRRLESFYINLELFEDYFSSTGTNSLPQLLESRLKSCQRSMKSNDKKKYKLKTKCYYEKPKGEKERITLEVEVYDNE